MWTRELLKSNAKLALKDRYWIAIATSFIAGMFSGGTPGLGGSFFSGNFRAKPDEFDKFKDFITQKSEIWVPVLIGVSVIAVMAVLAGLAFGIFVAGPVRVGQSRFYLQNRMGRADIFALFSAFRPGYMNVVKTVFLKNLYIFLWSLLFVIPGIIKSFEYIAVEYILAENPQMDSARALEISRALTKGEKWEIFVLGLSFIGWGLLCVMTCGVGFLFLAPYIQATFAELYTALREKALAENLAGFDELPGIAVI